MSACIDGLIDLDRQWCYVDFDDDPAKPVVHTYTEDQILREYWPWWSARMHKLGRVANPRQCIEDWIIVNWASRT